jgi:hypothetical protein
MIGVETILTIQISWLQQANSKYFTSFFANFNSFSLIYGQISFVAGEPSPTRFGILGSRLVLTITIKNNTIGLSSKQKSISLKV